MPLQSPSMQEALETFVRGHAVGRGIAHPCDCHRMDNLWVMRDAPRKNPQNYRKEEWIAYETEPAKVDELARKHARGHYFIGMMVGEGASDAHVRGEFKRLQYRLLSTERLFAHSLTRIPKVPSPFGICRMDSPELAWAYGKASGTRPMKPELYGQDGAIRQFLAMEEGAIVGSVRSVSAGRSHWCTSMFVDPAYRRRGIGKALLAHMLRSDRSANAEASVLLATHTGALLYPHVGYRPLGTLYIYCPFDKKGR